jgi:hypothetical protein
LVTDMANSLANRALSRPLGLIEGLSP